MERTFCILSAASWLLLNLGCAGPDTVGPDFSSQGRDDSGLDLQRAFVPYDRLDPTCETLPPALAESKPLSTRGQRRIEKAGRLFAQQRYTEAGLELERALQSDPDNFGVHLELARTLRAAGSLDRCRSHLRRALELGPDNPEVHYLLARSALDEGDQEASLCRLRTALACPDLSQNQELMALVNYRMAQALEQEGYLTASLQMYDDFERTVSILEDRESPEPELATLMQVWGGSAGRLRSAIHERLGQYGQAADALSQALAVQAEDELDGKKLVALLSRAGRHQRAIEKARALVAEDPSAVALLLEVHRRAGHPQGALDDLANLTEQHPDQAQHVLNYVTGLQKLGRADEAQVQLERFAARHPERIALHWRLFDLYVVREAWGQAVASAARAMRQDSSAGPTARAKMLELAPEQATAVLEASAEEPAGDAETAFLLGSLANHVGQFDQADVQLGRAVALAPQLDIAQLELGALHIKLYRWTEALDLLKGLAPEPATQARVALLRGEAHRGLDQHEEAIQHFKSAARFNPQDARPLKALADVYERSGETLRAIRQYKAALEVDPLDGSSREALFGLYFRSGDKEEATGQLHKLRSNSGSPNRIARCVALLENDPRSPDLVRFRRTLEGAMDEAGADADSLTYIAITYLDEPDYDRALVTLKRAVEIAPNNSDALLALEYAYRMALQFDQAARTLRTLLKRHPNRKAWINGLVGVLVTDQQFDVALQIVRDRLSGDDLEEDPRNAYRNQMLEILGLARRFDGQIQALEGWLVAEPDDARLRAPLVQAYFAADKAADILERLEGWYEQTPSDGDLRRQLIQVLLSTEHGERACQVVLEALEADPDNDGLQLLLVTTLGEAGRHDDAIELARNCMLLARNRLAYQFQMRGVYADADRHEEAAKMVGEMLEEVTGSNERSQPLSSDFLRRMLAEHLIQARQYTDAQVKLIRWIENSPKVEAKFGYLLLLSRCREERGQKERAVEALEQAYELDPTDAGINNNLAYSWADTGINLDEAEKRLRYAVAQSPRSDAYLDSLGWVLYKKGQFVEAVKWLSRSLGAGPGDDPVILNHLGDALWRTGRPDEAGEHWAQAQQQAKERLQDNVSFNAAEYERVLESTGQKIKQQSEGQTPEVAPLGEGISLEDAAPVPARDRT